MVWDYYSKNLEDTLLLGRTIGERAYDGLCIGLCGDLGTGKTHLVKGIAAGMQIAAEITSPTFTLLHVYPQGREYYLNHFDLYRLESTTELQDIDFYSYGSTDVTVVEWADKFADELVPWTVWIRIRRIGETERSIRLESAEARAEAWLQEVRHDLVGN